MMHANQVSVTFDTVLIFHKHMKHILILFSLLLFSCAFEDVNENDAIKTTNLTSASFSSIVSFNPDTGTSPRDMLTLGPDGKLWGTAWQRGPNRIDPPNASCASSGNWSTDYQAKWCPGTVFRVSNNGTIEVMHGFGILDSSSRNVDGYQPTSTLVYGGDGWMYGTTSKGGIPAGSATQVGVGVLYRINVATGQFQVVHSFCSLYRCADGMYPYGAPRSDGRGHLMIGLKAGGTNNTGVIDILDIATQTLSVVRSFGAVTYVRNSSGAIIDSYNTDGGNVFTSPIVGWDNKMHIATPAWGPSGTQGTLLTIGYDGSENVDANFPKLVSPINLDNSSMGTLTVSGLDGHIFGFRPLGGINATGSLFEANADGSLYHELYSFDTTSVNTPTGHYANVSGATPEGTLLEEYNGSFLGTTYYGGEAGRGVVFRYQRGGLLTVLLSWHNDGGPQYTSAGLTRGSDGNIYGISQLGGAIGGGLVYRLDNL